MVVLRGNNLETKMGLVLIEPPLHLECPNSFTRNDKIVVLGFRLVLMLLHGRFIAGIAQGNRIGDTKYKI